MILRGIYWAEFALHGTKGIVILPDMMAWHIWANTSFTPATVLLRISIKVLVSPPNSPFEPPTAAKGITH